MGLLVALGAAAYFVKKYERILRFVMAVLLLPILFIAASYTSNIYAIVLSYAIGLLWGFFVALFAYGLIFKKGMKPKINTGNI